MRFFKRGLRIFFNKYGECLLGEGVSPILLIGFITTKNPTQLRKCLLDLHKEVISDEYFKDVPSIEKTKIAFHAKDDIPEIREKVLKCL
ncbi:MAG: hypothetical protein VKK32_03245 [Candidatus Melainabacteria bacterium]|nr:hypothetical protein [Candidatus Melainabacteria bacterium]